MSQYSPQSAELPALTEAAASDSAETSRWPFQRVVKYIAIGVVALIVLMFLFGLLLALLTNVEATAPRIQIIRDIFIIILALQGILVVLGLVVLIMQVARLVNLLQNEIMPILEDTKDTVSTARGTVEFVGSNLTEPIVRAGGFLAGTRVLIREVGGIRRAVAPREGRNGHKPE
jgi:ABC-type sugar transport system permease subunit